MGRLFFRATVTEVNPNDETRNPNQTRSSNDERIALRHSDFVIDSDFWFRILDFPSPLAPPRSPRYHSPAPMTPSETTILSLVYVASLLLAQRLIAFVLPDLQEISFFLAALAGSLTAAVFYYKRKKKPAPRFVIFNAGAVMGVLALVVGMVTQLLWQSLNHPIISLPLAAALTMLLPFAIFPLGRAMMSETRDLTDDAGPTAVAAAFIICIGLAAAAFMIPAPGHSTLKLIAQTFPGLQISLPNWSVSENSVQFESGAIKLADPSGQDDKYISLRWSDSDPIQPDDYIRTLTGGLLQIKDRSMTQIGSHEGVTYYLESDSGSARAVATVWNCPNDHRAASIFTAIAGSKPYLLATHQRIVDSVHCHTGAATTMQTEQVFPRFAPPPGFVRDTASKSLSFVGPGSQSIVFAPAVAGQSDLAAVNLPPALIAGKLKEMGLLESVDGTPESRTVQDLSGHPRRVWSASGKTRAGNQVQVEVMVWWCDRRDMTFSGAYATKNKHDVSEGINALLPAVCHEEK
jgi:hypothetical protein